MTVRMNAEEVAIETRAGKANETNGTGTRRSDPRARIAAGEEDTRNYAIRTEYRERIGLKKKK